jgi:hypothetical protein
MKRLLIALLAVGAVVLSSRADAHHSFPATYVDNQVVTIEGEILQIVLRNPHSFMHLLVKQANGATVRYAVEWSGARQLLTQGVTSESLRPGDHVVIKGAPGRNPADYRVRMFSLWRPRDGFGWGVRPGEMS